MFPSAKQTTAGSCFCLLVFINQKIPFIPVSLAFLTTLLPVPSDASEVGKSVNAQEV
jgi:hypothetical protein